MAQKTNSFNLDDILTQYSAEKKEEMVATGVPPIDLLLGGGISIGSVYAFWAGKGAGKSTISIQIAKAFLEEGYSVAHIDVEKALTPMQQRNFGVRKYVESGQFMHLTATTYVQADEICQALCKSASERGIKLIILDSETMLMAKLPEDTNVADLQPGTSARQAVPFLNKLKSSAYENGVSVIIISHARANIGATTPYSPKDNMAGGYALQHVPDAIVQIKAGAKIGEDKTQPIGQTITITTDKNKFAPPFRKVEAPFMFGKGVDCRRFLIDWAVGAGIIARSGSRYEFDDKKYNGISQVYSMDEIYVSKLAGYWQEYLQNEIQSQWG